MTTRITELEAARAFLRRQFPGGGHVLCAVSGGLDSMCLLHFMTDWGMRNGFAVTAAHFNHQLRGEDADRDETFVRSWCAARDIPFAAGRGDVRGLAARKGLSVEEAARKARYDFLEETAERLGCDAVLTAHHADDNAETMLLNLIRGTGLKGLRGIPQVRGNVCRPFLRTGREELEAYAAAHDIPHMEDATNADPDAAARNLLRLRVMPLLKELNPRAVENMSRSAGVLERENEAVERLAESFADRMHPMERGVSVSCAALLEMPAALAERMVLQMLSTAAGHRKDLTAAHVEAVLDLAERGRGEVDLPYGLTARRDESALYIERRAGLSSAELRFREPLDWGGYTVVLLDHREGEGLALAAGPEKLTAAPCPAGARLTLPGAKGARTVKRLCVDRRIDLAERDGLPAIFVNDRLAAVWRLGVEKDFLPDGETCRFIQIRKKEENDHEK